MPVTEEWSKNPKAEVDIQCESCRNRYSIQEGLKEEGVEIPGRTAITEIFWLCPVCFHRKHSCYMSPELRVRQYSLKKTLVEYNKTHTSTDFGVYLKDQKAYQKVFDQEQVDIRRSLEENRERSTT